MSKFKLIFYNNLTKYVFLILLISVLFITYNTHSMEILKKFNSAHNKTKNNNYSNEYLNRKKINAEYINDLSSRKLSKTSPDLAREKINQIADSNTNITVKCVETGKILRDLVNDGYIDEAWSFVSPNPGSLRQYQISCIYECDLNVNKKLEWLKVLDENEKRDAIYGIIKCLSINDLKTFDFKSIGANSSIKADALRDSMLAKLNEIKYQDGPNKENLLLISWQLFGDEAIGDEEMSNILVFGRLANYNAEWDKFKNSKLDIGNYPEISKALINGMINENAYNTMNTVAFDSKLSNNFFIAQTLQEYFRQDSSGANDWISTNLHKLEPSKRDVAVSTAIKVALSGFEKQTATQWLTHITDPTLKAELRNTIEAK
jgi:hypothetical protein